MNGGGCLLGEMAERAYFQGVQDCGETCSIKIVCEGNVYVVLLGWFSHPGICNVCHCVSWYRELQLFDSFVLDDDDVWVGSGQNNG